MTKTKYEERHNPIRDTRQCYLGGVSGALVFVWCAAAALGASADGGGGGGGFTVAIDAGHGGTNLGTAAPRGDEGRTVYEKHVTLDLARRVRGRLAVSDAAVKVVLCRDRDVLQPIRARVRCANAAGARLFLSLHANSSPEGPTRGSQRGFELYVLPPEDVDQDVAAAQLAAADDVAAAWSAHRVRAAAEESAAAARRIQLRLGEALGASSDRGIKQTGAALDVLRGANMPAVLVEVGFLDHREEGAVLASVEGRETIATALAKAISDWRIRDARGVSAMAAPAGPARGGRATPAPR